MSDLERLFSILSNNLLGFDNFQHLDFWSGNTPSFPPVNIYREQDREGCASDPKLQNASGDYIIEMALSGYSPEDVEVNLETLRGYKVLTIESKAQQKLDGQWFHRGIASRAFKRTFSLLDSVDVVSAELVNGLLTIRLAAETPTRNVVKVPVLASSNKRPALTAETSESKSLPRLEEVEAATRSKRR